jgi:hypothetical protein
MKLQTALRVASQKLMDGDNRLVMYQSKNGQYMTGEYGNPAVTRKVWTWAEFINQFAGGKPRAKVGDRVKVVNASSLSFGDYENGDTGVVYRVEGLGVNVKWDKPRFNDGRDNMRCEFIFHDECEVVPA